MFLVFSTELADRDVNFWRRGPRRARCDQRVAIATRRYHGHASRMRPSQCCSIASGSRGSTWQHPYCAKGNFNSYTSPTETHLSMKRLLTWSPSSMQSSASLCSMPSRAATLLRINWWRPSIWALFASLSSLTRCWKKRNQKIFDLLTLAAQVKDCRLLKAAFWRERKIEEKRKLCQCGRVCWIWLS